MDTPSAESLNNSLKDDDDTILEKKEWVRPVVESEVKQYTANLEMMYRGLGYKQFTYYGRTIKVRNRLNEVVTEKIVMMYVIKRHII